MSKFDMLRFLWHSWLDNKGGLHVHTLKDLTQRWLKFPYPAIFPVSQIHEYWKFHSHLLLKFPLPAPVFSSHPEYITTKIAYSLRASSMARSVGRAGKGRRACNYVSRIWISASKKSMQSANDISNDVITLGMCFSPSVCIHARFCYALTGGNLIAQSSGSQRGIGGGIQSFSCPAARAPQRACSHTKNSQIPPNLLWTLPSP